MCSAGYLEETGNVGVALHNGITHIVMSRTRVM